VLILGALVPLLDFVPGAVVAFAMTVGWGLLTSASGTDFAFKTGPFTVMLVSFVIGGLYGWVGSILVGRLTGATNRTSAPASAPTAA
jgi:MFS superfamily sulfate permease-like transporter